MSLDRQAIERRDFPIARRGYDPEAVDAHLAVLADAIETLGRRAAAAEEAVASAAARPAVQAPAPAAQAGPASLALAASEQVRGIVEAAEASAADIERGAREDADRILREASEEAARVRAEVIQRSQDHVGKVGQATSLMLQRVDAMESEMGSLLDAVRTGSTRLTADLSLLHASMSELYDGDAPSEAAVAAAAAAAGPVAAAQGEPAAAADAAPAPEPAPPTHQPAPASEPGAAAPAAGGGDTEGARIIALNMALNGQSREETDRYLRENFDLDDREALLDDVWATIGA